MVKVLICDDSRTTRTILRTIFHTASDIRVIGEAENGQEAIDLNRKLNPDIITMDLHMPLLDGVEAVREIMSTKPVPILVVTGAEEEGDSSLTFQALQFGALEIVDKPQRVKGERYQDIKDNLIEKIRTLAQVKVNRYSGSSVRLRQICPQLSYQIVAIGASTGGPRVLSKILGPLPRDYPLPILLVQHITSSFTSSFARWLKRETSLKVQIADDGAPLEGGVIYIAPSDSHMTIRDGKIALTYEDPVNGCLPSADVLFRSLARECGQNTLAILLTGMGEDGARGMKEIRDCQGLTIAQSEDTCTIFGMPKKAIDLGAVKKILPPEDILKELVLASVEK